MSLINIINELVVSNVSESIKFYQEIFGFEIELTDGNPITWVQLKKNNLIIMLVKYNMVKEEINNYPVKSKSSNIIMFQYKYIKETKELYNKLKENNIKFFLDYTETNYGKIEFGIYDLDNNMILISTQI